jgi:ABC-type uncharacterized transport system substrate-binding protein
MSTELDEFLSGGLHPHNCAKCGTCVLVKKNSWKHTSIQWTTDAATSCPVLAERAASGANTALVDACEPLTESIADAARVGLVEVGDE